MNGEERLVLKRLKEISETKVHDHIMSTGKGLSEKLNLYKV